MGTQAILSNSSLLPSAKDLLYVVPRLAQRAIGIVPDAMDLAGKIWQDGGSIVADATGQTTTSMDMTITNTSAMLAQSTVTTLESAMSEVWREGAADEGASAFGLVLQGIGRLKNFGGIFSYLTSRWALATFTAAVILNRTQFYASSREHLRLRWHTKLAIYMIPISAFSVQLLYIAQALKCQTSPDFPRIRYGDPLKNLAIDFASEGGFLYKIASALVFWQDDTACCAARHMSLSSVDGDRSELRGSLSLLFWFFITLCTGQFFETLCCALGGKQPMPETGMTILEHSLAFAECEAMISSALGFGLFGLPKLGNGGEGTATVSRGEIMQRLNVPPEVLLVCIISCFSHLSSAILAITGIRHKVRLLNTGIWALCYMSALLWSFLRIFLRPVETITDLGVLRFPTVCIVGFIPHILILVGITICSAIYSLALLVTAFSVPEEISEGMSFRGRLSWAYSNLQANVQFSSASSIRIKMSEDFYTTLLKIGFSVLTAASEAVYLNEGSRIQVAKMTWLEQKRIDELAGSIEQRQIPSVPAELLGEGIARGVSFADYQNTAISQSPYARERKSKNASGQPDKTQAGELESGLGLTQRRSRMHLTFDFVAGILGLIISVQAQLVLNLLTRIGMVWRPNWLLRAAGIAEGQWQSSSQPVSLHEPQGRDFWMVGPNGQLVVPQNDDVDVEAETRRRRTAAGNYTGEDSLSNQLYGWWQSGGWFGTVDGSGEYVSKEMDDDLTSVISTSTDTTDDRSDIDDDDTGRRTPTQEDPHGERETTPANDSIDVGLLSRLLNPQSAAEREEARLLSYTLL
ncbi:ASI3 putative integral membrane E3 ubiquitin ligase [Teratosphaeria destructans]|uniref:ASI3 putative integral membrane E3 ubiquitin ligase n=1 Tax=Teratosphaeria destructans TaxID=418781 RepID=A0A9W7SSZ1_9PEZI|nr:ASI3 putative integral membrane E3 ubiquitin ligase [Teratosphaeria destructans]